MIVLPKASFLSQVYINLLWLYYILVFVSGWLLFTYPSLTILTEAILDQLNPSLLVCPSGSVQKTRFELSLLQFKREKKKKKNPEWIERSSKAENVEKEQPSACLVSMLPFQYHVLTFLI